MAKRLKWQPSGTRNNETHSRILLVAIVATTQAEPKVTLIDGSWNPGEGGAVTTRPNPLHRPFGCGLRLKGPHVDCRTRGGPGASLANGVRARRVGTAAKVTRVMEVRLAKRRLTECTIAIGPDDSVYISDSWNHCIRKIDADGRITTIAGTGKPGLAETAGRQPAQFSYIMCITLNPKGDKLHIADLKNRRIREMDLNSGIVKPLPGTEIEASRKTARWLPMPAGRSVQFAVTKRKCLCA